MEYSGTTYRVFYLEMCTKTCFKLFASKGKTILYSIWVYYGFTKKPAKNNSNFLLPSYKIKGTIRYENVNGIYTMQI